MNPPKRRGPVLGNRPPYAHESTTTTALDGPSLSLSKHWIRYQEDQFGDFYEPPESAPVRVTRGAAHDCGVCGCVLQYAQAA
jgi:hypothetical protein